MKIFFFLISLYCLLFTQTLLSAEFSEKERGMIQSLSGNGIDIPKDPTNQVSGHPLAIKLGKELFYDTRLTPNNDFSCSTCHLVGKGWSDGRTVSKLHDEPPNMHTPTLWNVSFNRWFFWDGRADTLWNQATHTFESPQELNSNRVHIARFVLKDKALQNKYIKLFDPLPECISLETLPLSGTPASENTELVQNWESLSSCQKQAVNRIFTNITKTIAAFEETIISFNSPFDQFALELKHKGSSTILSEKAQQGLKLFMGEARCIACHSGPNFSDSEFHSVFFDRDKQQGRYTAIPKLLSDPFNSAGTYSDLPADAFNKLDYVYRNIELRKKYKTPTLRNISQSAPYMHDGSMHDLKSVVSYYNDLAETVDPSEHDELILITIDINEKNQEELIAFMETLTQTMNQEQYQAFIP